MKTHSVLPSLFAPTYPGAGQAEGQAEPLGPCQPRSRESKPQLCSWVPEKTLFAGFCYHYFAFRKQPSKELCHISAWSGRSPGRRFLIRLKGTNALKPFLGCSGAPAFPRYLGHPLPVGSQERGETRVGGGGQQGKETLAPTSTAWQVCGTGSAAVPGQCSSAHCLVVGCILKAISPGPREEEEEEAGGIALERKHVSPALQGTQAAARLQSIYLFFSFI